MAVSNPIMSFGCASFDVDLGLFIKWIREKKCIIKWRKLDTNQSQTRTRVKV